MSAARLVLPRLKEYGLYIAGPEGFTEEGRRYHLEVLLPRLARLDRVTIHNPWEELLKIPESELVNLPVMTRQQAMKIGDANFALIDKSAIILANLNGPDVDSGTSIEIGYAHRGQKLVVGYRTDLRKSGEHGGVIVNLQVQHAIERSGGIISRSLDGAVQFIEQKIVEATATLGGGGSIKAAS